MHTPGNDRLITISEVMERTSLSRSYIHALVKKGQFPKQIKMGPKCSRWSEALIDKWIAEKAG